MAKFTVLIAFLLLFGSTCTGLSNNGENADEVVKSYQNSHASDIYWQNFSLPVVKRGTVSNATITFSSNTSQHPQNLVLLLSQRKIWEFPGIFGKYQNFTMPLELDFSSNSSYQINIETPTAKVNSASILLASNVSQIKYDFKFYLGSKKVWERNTSSQIFVYGVPILNSTNNLFWVDVCDLNMDGLEDIITLDRNGNMIAIENCGDGSFVSHNVSVLDYQDHPAKKAIPRKNSKTGMFDVFFQFSDCILYVKNMGNFNFTRAFAVASPGSGISDFILTQEHLFLSKDNGYVYIYNFTEDSLSFWESIQFANTSINTIIQYNGELIAGGADGNLYFENGANLSVSLYPVSTLTSMENGSLLIGDTNGTLYLLTPSISITKITQKPWQSINRIVCADFNQDGKEDIVFSTHLNNFYVLLANGSSYTEVYAGQGYSCAAADVDGSGIDVVSASYQQKVFLYRNNRNLFMEEINLTMALAEYINASQVVVDGWGNTFTILNITFYGIAGKLRVSNLNIDYNYTATVHLTEKVIEYVASASANETGFVNVPLTFQSDLPFTITPAFFITYISCPPYMKKLVPEIVMDEDGFPVSGINLLNLNDIFADDVDKNLHYRIVYMEKPEKLWAEINGSAVSFYPAKDWYGRAMFCVAAIDSENLETRSNYFNVTVREVNDPPVIDALGVVEVNKNVDFWLNLSSKIHDVDSQNFTLSTDSPYIETFSENLSLLLRFPEIGEYNVNITISDGIDSTTAPLTVKVFPYGFPLWKPIPPIYTQKNRNISASEGIDLLNYIIDVDTPSQNLKFSVLHQSNSNISVSILGTRLQVNLTYNYVGRSSVTVAVNDSTYENHANFDVIVNETNYAPIYLGGLNSTYIVYEDTELIIELSRHFFDVEDGINLTYGCTSSAITINGSLAIYTPKHSASNLSVQFFAIDSAGQSVFTPSINFTFIEVNDKPVYLGGIENATIYVNQTWSIELDRYFWDEEGNLTYASTDPRILIKNHKAEFISELPGTIVFKIMATDGEYTIYSQNITITVLAINQKPRALIVKISPVPAYPDTEVNFVGEGYDADGTITEYLWTSSIDGVLSTFPNFTKKLSIGEHIVKFRVKDNNNTWSDYAETIVVVREHVKEVNPVVPYIPPVAITCLVLGFVFNISGRILMRRRR